MALKVISFKVDSNFIRLINAVCRIKKINRSELIRNAIDEYIKKLFQDVVDDKEKHIADFCASNEHMKQAMMLLSRYDLNTKNIDVYHFVFRDYYRMLRYLMIAYAYDDYLSIKNLVCPSCGSKFETIYNFRSHMSKSKCTQYYNALSRYILALHRSSYYRNKFEPCVRSYEKLLSEIYGKS